MTNIETLSVQGDRFGEEADAVEANLRAVMKEQQQVDIELLELKIMMQLDADKKSRSIRSQNQAAGRRCTNTKKTAALLLQIPFSHVFIQMERVGCHYV